MSDNPETGSDQDRHLTDSQLIENRVEQLLYPEEPDEQPDEGQEQENMESTEVEDDESEAEEDEAEAEEEAQAPEDDEAALEFESVDELAEALELERDDFLTKVKTTVKVDGEEYEVNLAELRDGYQRDSDYRKKTMELSEQRKAFESEQTQLKDDLQGRIHQATTLIDNLQDQILGEFQQINWEQLRAENPGEYAARLAEFQGRQGQLMQAQQNVQAEAEKADKEAQEQYQEQMKEIVQKERAALLDAVPNWKDPETAKAETKALTEYLKTRGFSEQEINGAYDHRIILLGLDAMKVSQVKEKSDVVKKKVKNLPKLVKPSAKKTQQKAQADLRNKLKAKIKKTGGRTADIADFLTDRM